MKWLKNTFLLLVVEILFLSSVCFAYGDVQTRWYDDNLVIIATGDKNSGDPYMLMDTTSIVKRDLNKGYEWKYSFISYSFENGEVDTSKPVLFELWALKHSAYCRTTEDVTDVSGSDVPSNAERMQLGAPITGNIMANIFDFMPKD